MLLPALLKADILESRIQLCKWDLTEWRMPKFHETRQKLPQAIKVFLKSCDAGGPTYRIEASQRTVELQDSWYEGDKSTAYFFRPKQSVPGYWTFDYEGYEWSGVTFVNKVTGVLANTPCNSAASMHFNPDGDRAVFLCSPQYGEELVELYAVALVGKPRFWRLASKPPSSEISVVWKTNSLATVEFHGAQQKAAVHKYNVHD